MGTPYSTVFQAFTSRVKDYDFGLWSDEMMEQDMLDLMNAAIPFFYLPKQSLARDDDVEAFDSDLNNEEVQIIAALMRQEWFSRNMEDTDVLQQKFGESDFEFKSQASHLNALNKTYLDAVRKEAKKRISNYSRATDGKPFNYKRMAGK